jgi:hypothetical protein
MNINPMQFMQQLNQLKSRGGDPNQMIQQLMNSGRISQAQYDNAVKQAQQIQQMLTPGAHR